MNYNPNSNFANYVTNVAFNISLSRSMCSLLLALAADEKRSRKNNDELSAWSGYGMFIPTVRSLQNRGLVIHHDRPESTPHYKHVAFTLTDEGRLVAELVRRAGLAIGEKSARNRKAA